jgi:uncharacterized protein YwgA
MLYNVAAEKRKVPERSGAMTERKDYLLLFISLPGGRYELDRIRVMKGMFLFAQSGIPRQTERYEFVPYDWGPFSRDVYTDLEALQSDGLLVAVPEGSRYAAYRVTDAGRQRAEHVQPTLPADATRRLGEIKATVTSKSFLELLEYVYERHSAFAQRRRLRR